MFKRGHRCAVSRCDRTADIKGADRLRGVFQVRKKHIGKPLRDLHLCAVHANGNTHRLHKDKSQPSSDAIVVKAKCKLCRRHIGLTQKECSECKNAKLAGPCFALNFCWGLVYESHRRPDNVQQLYCKRCAIGLDKALRQSYLTFADTGLARAWSVLGQTAATVRQEAANKIKSIHQPAVPPTPTNSTQGQDNGNQSNVLITGGGPKNPQQKRQKCCVYKCNGWASKKPHNTAAESSAVVRLTATSARKPLTECLFCLFHTAQYHANHHRQSSAGKAASTICCLCQTKMVLSNEHCSRDELTKGSTTVVPLCNQVIGPDRCLDRVTEGGPTTVHVCEGCTTAPKPATDQLECSVCSKQFASTSGLNRHRKACKARQLVTSTKSTDIPPQTPTQRRRTADAQRKKDIRLAATPTRKQQQQMASRQRMQQQRLRTTPTSKQQQQMAARQRMQQQRLRTTPTSKQQQQMAARQRMQQQRLRTTPTSKQQQQMAARQRMQQQRLRTTPTSKQQQQVAARQRMRQQRLHASPATQQRRRMAMRIRIGRLRQREHPNRRMRRLITAKLVMHSLRLARYSREADRREEEEAKRREQGLTREQELAADVQQSRDADAVANADTPLQQDAFTAAKAVYFRSVQEGFDFPCICCFRLLARRSVVKYQQTKYNGTNDVVRRVIDTFQSSKLDLSKDSVFYICKYCHEKLGGVAGKRRSEPEMPDIAYANGRQLDEIPVCFQDANDLEVRLVSLQYMFLKLVELHRKPSYTKVRGGAVNVEIDTAAVVQQLPRLADESGIVPLKLKRAIKHKGHVLYQTVRVARVLEMLQYLIANNPLYAKITFNPNWATDWEEKDSEFSNALFVRDALTSTELVQEEQEDDDATTPAPLQQATDSDTADVAATVAVEPTVSADADNEEIRQALFEETAIIPTEPILTEDEEKKETAIYMYAPGEGKKPVSLLREDKWDALCFPQLFPMANGRLCPDKPRETPLEPGRFVESALFSVDKRFRKPQYIFACHSVLQLKRLANSINTSMRKSKAKQSGKVDKDPAVILTAEMASDRELMADLSRSGRLTRFMAAVCGSPAYWHVAMQDVLAMVRTVGVPTWFLSCSSAEMNDDALIQRIHRRHYGWQLSDNEMASLPFERRCYILRMDPVACARQFDYKWREFLHKIICDKVAMPVGLVTQHWYRMEMQLRGAPHIHALLWIDNAPKIEETTTDDIQHFIDRYTTVEIPPEGRDDELRELVTKVQKHGHRKTCFKAAGRECRFHFPKEPSEKTIIVRDEDLKKEMQQRKAGLTTADEPQPETRPLTAVDRLSIVLRRTKEEEFINNYNAKLLKIWKANMDIQFVTNTYACIAYVLSYATKSEAELSYLIEAVIREKHPPGSRAREIMKTAASTFIRGRECSSIQSVFEVCPSIRLKFQSMGTVFLPNCYPEERTRMMKPMISLAALNKDSTDIFIPGLTERYEQRPKTDLFDDMCIAEFASHYQLIPTKRRLESDDNQRAKELEFEEIDEVEGEDVDENMKRITPKPKTFVCLNNQHIRKRLSQAALKFIPHSLEKDVARFWYGQAFMFLPFRDEGVDLAAFRHNLDDAIRRFQAVINENCAVFQPIHSDKIMAAIEFFRQNPALMQMEFEKLDPEGMQHEYDGLEAKQHEAEEDEEDNFGDGGDPFEGTDQIVEGSEQILVEENIPELWTANALQLAIGQLNHQQRDILDEIDAYAVQLCEAERTSTTPPKAPTIFVSGPGGTGKSHLIFLVRQLLQRKVAFEHYQQPQLIVSRTAAFTGTAAFNVDGTTIHALFSMPPLMLSAATNTQMRISAERLDEMRSKFEHVKLIIIDEISMVSHSTLRYIDEILRRIKRNELPFGGIGLFVLGDLYQLAPVRQKKIYHPENKLAAVIGHLWCDHFELRELTVIMRQKNIDFANLLNRVRIGRMTQADVNILRSRIVTKANAPLEPLRVFPTNAAKDEYNTVRIDALRATATIHKVVANDEFANANYRQQMRSKVGDKGVADELARLVEKRTTIETGGLPSLLEVGVGARIMITKNVSVVSGLVNGAFGLVQLVSFPSPTADRPVAVWVTLDNVTAAKRAVAYRSHQDVAHLVRRCAADILPHWIPIVPYTQTFQAGIRKIDIQRRQFPLVLAYGATIHKTQGTTVDEIVIDFCNGKGNRAGLAYVALSRVTSLQGLRIVGDFKQSLIIADQTTHEEMQRLRTAEIDSRPVITAARPTPTLPAPKTTIERTISAPMAEQQTDSDTSKSDSTITMDEPNMDAVIFASAELSLPHFSQEGEKDWITVDSEEDSPPSSQVASIAAPILQTLPTTAPIRRSSSFKQAVHNAMSKFKQIIRISPAQSTSSVMSQVALEEAKNLSPTALPNVPTPPRTQLNLNDYRKVVPSWTGEGRYANTCTVDNYLAVFALHAMFYRQVINHLELATADPERRLAVCLRMMLDDRRPTEARNQYIAAMGKANAKGVYELFGSELGHGLLSKLWHSWRMIDVYDCDRCSGCTKSRRISPAETAADSIEEILVHITIGQLLPQLQPHASDVPDSCLNTLPRTSAICGGVVTYNHSVFRTDDTTDASYNSEAPFVVFGVYDLPVENVDNLQKAFTYDGKHYRLCGVTMERNNHFTALIWLPGSQDPLYYDGRTPLKLHQQPELAKKKTGLAIYGRCSEFEPIAAPTRTRISTATPSDVAAVRRPTAPTHTVLQRTFYPATTEWRHETAERMGLPLSCIQPNARLIPKSVWDSNSFVPSAVSEIRSDGHCLYRCFSEIVFGTQELHLHFRKMITNFEQEHAEQVTLEMLNMNLATATVYNAAFSAPIAYWKHVSYMKEEDGSLRSWGTSLELYVAAKLLDTCIWVYADNRSDYGRSQWWVYTPHGQTVPPTTNKPEIYLVNTGRHFQPVWMVQLSN